MAELPAACPSLGYGSTGKPVYPATTMAIRCWARGCKVILPSVEALAEELRVAGDFDEYVWEENYPRLLAAALSDDLGLCPRCLRRLVGFRPKPVVDAFAVLEEAATRTTEQIGRFMAADRQGQQ